MKDNVTELKKRYEALGEEIKKLERQTFTPGWYMYCDNNQEVYRIEYLIREDTYANTCWDNVVPVTQEVLDKFLPKKATMYDWSKAPDWAQWAATDEEGDVNWYEEKPTIDNYIGGWLPERKRYNYASAVNRIVAWKDSLEERPSGNK
jgi:hypothetical protein